TKTQFTLGTRLAPAAATMPQPQAVAARRLAIYRSVFVTLHTIVVLACAPTPYAQIVNLTLAWDPNPEPNIAGYVVSIGTQSRQYTTNIDVGNVKIRTIQLAAGAAYFFAA